jgi:hypothetical protein
MKKKSLFIVCVLATLSISTVNVSLIKDSQSKGIVSVLSMKNALARSEWCENGRRDFDEVLIWDENTYTWIWGCDPDTEDCCLI